MNRKRQIKGILIAGLFLLALGGWLLHLRIHPLAKDWKNYIPFIFGAISVFAIPLLFCSKRTLTLAYILNGLSVIFGTVGMAHFSIRNFEGPVTLAALIFNTTLPDISILWAKFAVGKALFNLEFLKSDADVAAKGRFFRYPNMGWWWAHLIGVAAIYTLGFILWK